MGCTLFVFYILHIAGYYFRKENNRRREKFQRTLGWEIDKDEAYEDDSQWESFNGEWLMTSYKKK